jgi:hypothetical protein
VPLRDTTIWISAHRSGDPYDGLKQAYDALEIEKSLWRSIQRLMVSARRFEYRGVAPNLDTTIHRKPIQPTASMSRPEYRYDGSWSAYDALDTEELLRIWIRRSALGVSSPSCPYVDLNIDTTTRGKCTAL